MKSLHNLSCSNIQQTTKRQSCTVNINRHTGDFPVRSRKKIYLFLPVLVNRVLKVLAKVITKKIKKSYIGKIFFLHIVYSGILLHIKNPGTVSSLLIPSPSLSFTSPSLCK